MRFKATLTAMTFVFAASAAQAQDVCDQTYVMGAEPWAPFTMKVDGEWAGIDVDIVRAGMDKLGCEVEVHEVPWKRHLHTMENGGDIHIASSASKTPERATYGTFTQPYRPSQSVLILPAASDTSYKSLQEFLEAGKSIGIMASYEYGGAVNTTLEQYPDQVQAVSKLELNLKKLVRGRIDGMVGDSFVVASKGKQMGLRDKIQITDTLLSDEQVFMMFATKTVSKDFVQAFDNTLTEMKENGELATIFAKYTE